MRLSLCMIVRDEAVNLPRCLSSVKDTVDEMVVLDTGSTDRTPEIARSFGATVNQFEWSHDFSIARNHALQKVTGDWVLVLDADEVLVPQVVPDLRQAMQRETALVINLVRQEVGAAQSPYSLVSRLFRRHPDIYFSRPYHAMIDDSVADLLQREPQWQVIHYAPVAIQHYGYEPGTIASRNKLEKARATMEGFLQTHPNDAYVCSKLGALYEQMGHVQQGIALLERGVQTAGQAAVLYELHYHLGIAYNRLHQIAQAEQHYRSAIQQPILDRLKLGALNNLGSLLHAKDDLQGAEASYRACLEIDPDFAIGHYNLGMVLKAKGQPGEAIAHYRQAIALNPNYAEAYQNLGTLLLKLGQVADSLEAFGRAIALHELHNPTEADRLRQGLQSMGFVVGQR